MHEIEPKVLSNYENHNLLEEIPRTRNVIRMETEWKFPVREVSDSVHVENSGHIVVE